MSVNLSLIVTLLVGTCLNIFGQDVIYLNNPSFEDTPRAGGMGFQAKIKGWHDCASTVFPEQTPPDIHPHPQAWMVDVGPKEGSTFLGMVVRDDETHEFLSQAMELEIKADQCYDFNIFLAQSDTYMGIRNQGDGLHSDSTYFSRPFMTPAVLRIWGGSRICKKDELLAVSDPVENRTWEMYSMRFEPEQSHRYITLEAFYKTPVLLPYNGHILVDNASAIVQTVCDETVAELIEEKQDVINRAPVETAPPPPPVQQEILERPTETPPTVEAPARPEYTDPGLRIMRELNPRYLAEGQTIRVKNLYFKADSSSIEKGSYEVLDELYRFLKLNPDIVIEIGGHTNTKPEHWYCDDLSQARAKAVSDYLIAQGIPQDQVQYKGYGKRKPLIPDDKYSPAAQRKNQRVEVTIISLDG